MKIFRTRTILLNPDVQMKYQTFSFLWIFRFSYGAKYAVKGKPECLLRETEVRRLNPWQQVSWLDRFGAVFFLTGLSACLLAVFTLF